MFKLLNYFRENIHLPSNNIRFCLKTIIDIFRNSARKEAAAAEQAAAAAAIEAAKAVDEEEPTVTETLDKES